MLYSAACEYAILAATHLAIRRDREYVKLQEVAEAAGAPRAFLASICQTLVNAGILRSARGPKGGYALTRPPAQVTLHEIKAAVDGLGDLGECAVGLGPCSDELPCPLHDSFKPIRQQIEEYLKATTLERMAEALQDKQAKLGRTISRR